jgi:SAM-dependent methyltransferase
VAPDRARGRASGGTPIGHGGRPADRAAELARLYDVDMADEQADVELYIALARAATGPILELAAGSGRICVPLARAGHAVVAVDNDPRMLARAADAWAGEAGRAEGDAGSLELVEADITSLALGRQFGLVILGLNSLLLLPGRDAQLAALRVMAAHLAPGGRAVIDVILPSPEDLSAYDGRLEVAWVQQDPSSGEHVAKLWSARYEPASMVAHVTTFFETWPADGGPVQRLARTDQLHLVGAHELLDLAARAGLGAETVAGDHEMGPFGPDSPRIVLVAGLL